MVKTVPEVESQVAGKNGDVPHIKFPPEADRPCYRVYRHAFIAEDRLQDPGIYYHGLDEDRNGNREPFDRRILSNVNVLAIVRTDAGTEHSYLIEYVPHGEKVIRRCVMPQSILLGRAEEVTKFLRPLGVTAHYQDKDLIRTYLDYQHDRFDTSTPTAFWQSAKVVGWHSRSSFVLPTEIIGKQEGVWLPSGCVGISMIKTFVCEKGQRIVGLFHNKWIGRTGFQGLPIWGTRF